jgi:uncharacterized membrane protein
MARNQRVRRRLLAAVLVVVAGVIAIGFSAKPPNYYWLIVISAALGVLLAISELVARYRDDPAAAILSIPAVVYVTANAAAAAAAFYVIHAFGWNFGATGAKRELTQVLAAGLGSAAVFRASLLNVSVGDQIIGVGPSAFLNIILSAADRAVDRQRAVIREARAEEYMQGISFDKSAEELLAYCVAAMQNTSPSEAKAIENRISDLRNPKNSSISDRIKSRILGFDLLTLVGEQVLKQATGQLKAAHEADPARGMPPESSRPPAVPEGESEVLRILAEARAAMPVQRLREAAGLGLEQSVSLLSDLEQRGLVAVEGQAGRETVRLTGPDGPSAAD